jgi:hypothetical protein
VLLCVSPRQRTAPPSSLAASVLLVSAPLLLLLLVYAPTARAVTNCGFTGSLGNYDLTPLAGKDYSGPDVSNVSAYTVAFCGPVSESTCKQAKSGHVANGCLSVQ